MRYSLRVRILSFLIAVISVLALSGCSSAKPVKGSEDELRVVGTVGEFEVLYEEFRFIVMSYKQILIEKYGEGIFTDPKTAAQYTEILQDYVYKNITANYAVLTMCREVGMEASDPELQEAVQKEIEKTINDFGSRRKYKRYLNDNYMTDNFYRFNTCVDKMQNELLYVYVDDLGLIESDDDKIYDIIKNEFVRTQHIYVSKNNKKSYEENKEYIQSLYSMLCGGADFMQLAESNGENKSLTSQGEYITKGYMSDKYEETAFSLGIGEYSGIIEDENGFYIIKRLETESLYIMMNFEELSDRYIYYSFMEMINETQSQLAFVPNDYLLGINITEVN